MEKKEPRKAADLNVTAFNTLSEFLSKNDPKPAPDKPAVVAALDNAEVRRQLMREMGRRGGKKGGKARAKALTPAKRKKIARAAAQSRWHPKCE